MKAMILAAGRGERMRPLTDTTPKPLLKVNGKPLIVYHIEKLVAIGITDIVINHAWLGDVLTSYLGDGSQFGANIRFSAESEGALETAGGIVKALPLLDDEPFLVINGDVFTDFDFGGLPSLAKDKLAHVILINNPEHNRSGDFLYQQGRLRNKTSDLTESISYTFSGIALYRPAFFDEINNQKDTVKALGPMLRTAAGSDLISASIYEGAWTDVGTPERLEQLNNLVNREY